MKPILRTWPTTTSEVPTAAGGGVNERVRDWNVDVERQFAEYLASVDPRFYSKVINK